MISIVIPTYNRPDLLVKCLECLLSEKQRISYLEYEVIISDDSSNDETKNLVKDRYPFFRYNAGPRRGPAANRNSGAKVVNGEWIMFIDDDCLPDKNIVLEYSKAIIGNPSQFVFEGCIKTDREPSHFMEESPINLTGGYMWSCNILVSKKVFVELEGFDENFPYPAMEDVDLHQRIKELNFPVIFVKDAFVIHPLFLKTNGIEDAKRAAGSHDYFYAKHPHLLKHENTFDKLKVEYRFWIRRILRNIIKFKGKGLLTVIKIHSLNKKLRAERIKKFTAKT
jgi:glycosyltransferase involved in cell wall biosynthesis